MYLIFQNVHAGCSDGSVPVNCLVNPCDTATCPAINKATCAADYCGGCNARWLLNGDDVTNQCQGQFARKGYRHVKDGYKTHRMSGWFLACQM